jgi:hypothetical protein
MSRQTYSKEQEEVVLYLESFGFAVDPNYFLHEPYSVRLISESEFDNLGIIATVNKKGIVNGIPIREFLNNYWIEYAKRRK